MNISGEHRIKSTPAKIRRQFEDPQKLRFALPDVVSAEIEEDGKILVKLRSLYIDGLIVSYHFFVVPGKSDKDFSICWQGLDPQAVFSNAAVHCSLKQERGATVVSFNAELDFGDQDDYLSIEPGEFIRGITQLLEQVADNLAKEERRMTDRKSDLDEALNNVEDAVLELEHEAEEAAAKGFLGGAQMWGWIALAAVILVLLVVF